VIRNAGNARIQGIEVEALLRPLPGLEIAANGSYLNAKLKSLAVGVPFTLSDHLTNTPKWVFNPSIQYIIKTGDRQSVTARVDYAYTSRVFYDLPNSYAVNAAGTNVTANGPNLFPTVQNGYGLLNTRLSYSRDDWTVAVFATNLTDKRYRTYGFSSTAAGITEAYYGPPRQYGLSVTRWF
jgi:iron complex outermembrane receptor protein